MTHLPGRFVKHVPVLLMVSAATSCAPRDRVSTSTIGDAWQAQSAEETEPFDPSEGASATGGASDATSSSAPPIATVDGRPIARHRVVDLLLRGHGAGVLEQLIVLEAAEAVAAERGLTVTAEDFDREYERALRRLADPLAGVTAGAFDREAADGLLDTVLSNRNISREEFRVGVRRNAYLRAIVESEQSVTEDQLRNEFERTYGARLRVRHIQLATRGEVARTQERLADGEDFAEVARRYSANVISAEEGGLLTPFSATDEDVPALLRETASRMQAGQVSSPLRIGEWFHILQLEETLPAREADFPAVRQDLERRLHNRLAEPAMRELYESLFSGATVEIHDPILRTAFERKHSN